MTDKMDENRLEDIEWTQYWAENCNKNKPFVLMIGDSISVGYRHFVYENIKDRYCAVTVSTSKAIDNRSFLKEIEFIASEEGFGYSVIHFNNGIHGYHLSTEEYALYYDEAVKFLISTYPDAQIILATSTPSTVPPDNKEFAEWNRAVAERNEAIKKLAEKYSLPVDDLYSLAVSHPEYMADDGVHFTMEGYKALGKKVADCITAV